MPAIHSSSPPIAVDPIVGVFVLGTIGVVPYQEINDPDKLRRLLDAVLLIEAGIDFPGLLNHIVEEACLLVDATYGALGVLNTARTSIEQFVTYGLTEDEERAIGPRPTGRGVLGLIITEPAALRLDDLHSHPDSYGYPSHHPPMRSFLGVPLRVRDVVYGNLYLTDKKGAERFTNEDTMLVESLALAAGIAIENTRLNDRINELSIADDRDRIARDLHDRVIQRVYAVGMALQGAARLPDLEQVLERIDRAVDDLDATITEIRTAIFELNETTLPDGLRRGVLDLTQELTSFLGFRPEVRFSGVIDTAVSQRTADHALAVVRESLMNVGKHAGATHVTVSLTVVDDFCLEISDNGSGLKTSDAVGTGRGLVNLQRRAEALHGSFELRRRDESGTDVVWRVPLANG